jgi:hypothetical protein
VNVLRFGLHRSLVLLAQRSPRLLRLLLGVRGGGRDMLGVAFGSSRLRVSGFSPDNWVGDRLEVVVEPREQTRRLALSGRPVAEMTVKVSANGAQLGEFPLHGSELEAVTIELPPGPREVVSFAFSAHALDTKGRRVSFLVQETNLFGEEDLYALV